MQSALSSKPLSYRWTALRRALMAVPAVVAIALALWLFVDRLAGAANARAAHLGRDSHTRENEISPEDRRAYRLNLAVQVLVLGFFVVLFFVHFLPYVLVATQEYGVPAHGLNFFRRLMDVLSYLFPNAVWELVGVAGLVGWYFMWRDSRTRHLGAVCILTAGISLAHFLAAQKLPYGRTCGYLLPLVTLGAMHLTELGLRHGANRLQPILAGAAAVGVGLLHANLRSAVSELVGYKQGLQHEFVNDRPYLTTFDQ